MKIESRLRAVMSCDGIDNWTRNFCESLLGSVEKYGKLSERQMEVFKQKEAEFNPQTIQKWLSNWDEEKAYKFQLCARYYIIENTYFKSITQDIVWKDVHCREIDWDATRIPSERVYNNFVVSNTYAQKIIKNHETPPKFDVGAVVKFREVREVNRFPMNVRFMTTRNHHHLSAPHFLPRHFVVIQNHEASFSPYKGRRSYCILGAGQSSPIQVEERYLMKVRKSRTSKKSE